MILLLFVRGVTAWAGPDQAVTRGLAQAAGPCFTSRKGALLEEPTSSWLETCKPRSEGRFLPVNSLGHLPCRSSGLGKKDTGHGIQVAHAAMRVGDDAARAVAPDLRCVGLVRGPVAVLNSENSETK